MGNVVLSPASPTQLVAYILAHCKYPTTLVVCSSSEDFVKAVAQHELEAETTSGGGGGDSLLQDASSLLQVAVARHIRVAFVPTVAHLRAFLAAWDPADSRVAPPPEGGDAKRSTGEEDAATKQQSQGKINNDKKNGRVRPSLFVYGFLQLHRGSSEWSAQGLSSTAVLLDEAADGTGMDAVVVETLERELGNGEAEEQKKGDVAEERVPLLSTVPRRQLQRAGYPLRSQRMRDVLSRWFEFAEGPWDKEQPEDKDVAKSDTEMPSPEKPPETPEQPEPAPETLEKPPNDSPKEAPRTFVRDSEDEDDLSELGPSP